MGCRRWWRTRSCRTARGRRSSSTWSCGADLIADFLNVSTPDFVEHGDYISVTRHSFGANRHFDVRICGVELKQSRHDLVVRHVLAIETDRIASTDPDRNIIFYRIGRWHAG